MVVCVLIITTLKEKLPCRRRKVHRRRVSVINSSLFEKTEMAHLWWGGGDCWLVVQYDITFIF